MEKIEPGTALEKVFAGALLALMRELVNSGVPATSAVRLASVALVAGAFGNSALHDLGVAERTVHRWRKEVREALERHGADELPLDGINKALEAMGVPFRVTLP